MKDVEGDLALSVTHSESRSKVTRVARQVVLKYMSETPGLVAPEEADLIEISRP